MRKCLIVVGRELMVPEQDDIDLQLESGKMKAKTPALAIRRL